MRLSEYFGGIQTLSPQIAEAGGMQGGGVVAQGQDITEGMPLFAPCGVGYIPAEGQRLLLLPFDDHYVCVGALADTQGLCAGELVLKSAGGACIHLKNSGEVVVNGLTITPDGQIAADGEG